MEKSRRCLVTFPEARWQLLTTLEGIADSIDKPDLHYPGSTAPSFSFFYTWEVLYEDYDTLPDAANAAPGILHEWEIPAYAAFGEALGAIYDDYDQEDDPRADPRWPGVVNAARRVIAAMEESDTW